MGYISTKRWKNSLLKMKYMWTTYMENEKIMYRPGPYIYFHFLMLQ